jgi:hypothetical protein
VDRPAEGGRVRNSARRGVGRSGRGTPRTFRPREVRVFFFFSNRLGCAGSLLVSAALTAVLLFVLFVLF